MHSFITTNPQAEDAPKEIRVVDSFIRDGKTVCTFAAHAAKRDEVIYCLISKDGKPRGEVSDAVGSFLKSRQGPYKEGSLGACILVDSVESTSDDLQRQRAHLLRFSVTRAIALLLLEKNGQPFRDDQLIRNAHELFSSQGNSIVGPRYGDKQTIMLAMGPRYRPEKHRRFAPRVILPLTLREDAKFLGDKFPELTQRVARDAEARSGSLTMNYPFYDDNLEMLDTKPQGPIYQSL